MPELSDSKIDTLDNIFARMEKGEPEALDELYLRLKSFLEAYVRKNRVIGTHLRPDACTTEVVHDALVELFRALERGKFTYQGKRGLLAWLIKVMLHALADLNNVPRPLALPCESIPDEKPTAEQVVILKMTLEAICDDLDGLAVQVFDLWLEGHSQREIAARLSCSRERVRRILELIVHRLHHQLANVDE